MYVITNMRIFGSSYRRRRAPRGPAGRQRPARLLRPARGLRPGCPEAPYTSRPACAQVSIGPVPAPAASRDSPDVAHRNAQCRYDLKMQMDVGTFESGIADMANAFPQARGFTLLMACHGMFAARTEGTLHLRGQTAAERAAAVQAPHNASAATVVRGSAAPVRELAHLGVSQV